MLRFVNLTLGYNRHPAVHHLECSVDRGDLLAVVGPNGAGKSTLLKGIAGVLTPIGGRIEAEDVHDYDIAYLPQRQNIDCTFPISVFETAAMGLWREIGAFARLSRDGARKVLQALVSVGLQGLEQRPISNLSGGQMQRVLFARLLLQDARVILLDEPFAFVDNLTVHDLMQQIRRWHRESRTVIAALHDLECVRASFPKTLLLAREKIAHGPTDVVLSAENLEKTRRMSETSDLTSDICRR